MKAQTPAKPNMFLSLPIFTGTAVSGFPPPPTAAARLAEARAKREGGSLTHEKRRPTRSG
jgi:hypothetical protein